MSKRNRAALAIILAIAVFAVLALAYSTRIPGASSQAQELDAGLEKWHAQNITHYTMKVHIGCFCPFTDRMPLTVEVQDGRVRSVIDSQGQSVAQDDPIRSFGNEQLMTMEGVFAYARDAIQTADEVKLSYDAAMGYPTSLIIDRIKAAVDDEMSVQITELQVLP